MVKRLVSALSLAFLLATSLLAQSDGFDAYRERVGKIYAEHLAEFGYEPDTETLGLLMADWVQVQQANSTDITFHGFGGPWWWQRAAGTIEYYFNSLLNRPPGAEGYGTYFGHQYVNGMTGEQLEAALKESDEYKNLHPPPPPCTISSTHNANFLTTVMPDGWPERTNIDGRRDRYQLRSDEERKKVRTQHVKDGRTRYLLDVQKDDQDGFADPQGQVKFFEELRADCLGPVVLLAPEDAPRMQAKYSPLSVYISALKKAVAVWKSYVTEYWLGVEFSESFPRANDALAIASAIRSTTGGTPMIVLHLNSGDLWPDGASSCGWWKSARAAGITHLAYQANHPRVEDAGNAFLANPLLIKDELRRAVSCVSPYGVKVISSEYAYFGTTPSKATISYVSKVGFQLGDKSLEVSGIVGITNGGPGHYPTTTTTHALVPDDVDIRNVSFFTRDARDISSEIRSWPIEARLIPSFSDNATYVYYRHTATEKEWPGNPNANSWLCFNRNSRIECYTNDYLRPNDPKKVWKGTSDNEGIDGIRSEPPIREVATKGRTVYLMASTPARLGVYGKKSRTQLVRIIAP